MSFDVVRGLMVVGRGGRFPEGLESKESKILDLCGSLLVFFLIFLRVVPELFSHFYE